jgi:hypothetical protein
MNWRFRSGAWVVRMSEPSVTMEGKEGELDVNVTCRRILAGRSFQHASSSSDRLERI